MQLILRNIANEFIKSLSFKRFELYQDFYNELFAIDNIAAVYLITENEKINSCELAKLKLILGKNNIKFSNIFSNNTSLIIYPGEFRKDIEDQIAIERANT